MAQSSALLNWNYICVKNL